MLLQVLHFQWNREAAIAYGNAAAALCLCHLCMPSNALWVAALALPETRTAVEVVVGNERLERMLGIVQSSLAEI